MQLSLEVDNDFMDLYREVIDNAGDASENEILKKALKGLIDNQVASDKPNPPKLTKSEKAKIDYINQTQAFIPKIIRRNVKSPANIGF